MKRRQIISLNMERVLPISHVNKSGLQSVSLHSQFLSFLIVSFPPRDLISQEHFGSQLDFMHSKKGDNIILNS